MVENTNETQPYVSARLNIAPDVAKVAAIFCGMLVVRRMNGRLLTIIANQHYLDNRLVDLNVKFDQMLVEQNTTREILRLAGKAVDSQ